MNKIKAITVLEIVVSMLISSLVIIMAYAGLDVFNESIRLFKNRNYEYSQLLLIGNLMHKDIEDSERVIKMNNGIQCFIQGSDVQYDFEDQYILRTKGSLTDTFYVSHKSPAYFMNNKEVMVSGLLVDYIKLEIFLSDENFEQVYCKNYGADIYINTSVE